MSAAAEINYQVVPLSPYLRHPAHRLAALATYRAITYGKIVEIGGCD